VSLLIMLPIMGAAISLFSIGANQQASEQSSIDANQDARSALELMTTEIAQAGSHGDRSTTTTAAITASSAAQYVSVSSSSGMMVGDWIDIDSGDDWESVKLTGVVNNAVSGVFRTDHASGVPLRLFARPFVGGIIPPTGLAANSSSTVTTLKFFGDINGDSNLQYVEYVYDSANAQITRSITPITQSAKNPAVPLVRNIVPNSVHFTVNTDSVGVATSVNLRMTVQNTWSTAGQFQETTLSSVAFAPSVVAGSVLLYEIRRYGGVDDLPPIPARVTAWTMQ
jgi:hypothetical protein